MAETMGITDLIVAVTENIANGAETCDNVFGRQHRVRDTNG